jgi:hypothetical protein
MAGFERLFLCATRARLRFGAGPVGTENSGGTRASRCSPEGGRLLRAEQASGFVLGSLDKVSVTTQEGVLGFCSDPVQGRVFRSL